MGNCYTGYLEDEELFEEFLQKVELSFDYPLKFDAKVKLRRIHDLTGFKGQTLLNVAREQGVDLSADKVVPRTDYFV